MDPYSNKKSTSTSPFFNSKIICPICGVPSTQRAIKPSYYTEQEVDVILRPTKVKWLKKEISKEEKRQPRLFYMRHCIFCKFTAADNNYENPAENYDISTGKFQKKMKFLQEKSANFKQIVTILSQGVNVLQPDYFQAVRLHLLAPFQLQFIEEVGKKDAFNIARYYLRLAWLFIDLEESEDLYHKYIPKINKFTQILRKEWKKAPTNSEEALLLAKQYYNTTLIKSRLIKSDLEEVRLLLLMCRVAIKLEDVKDSHKFLFGSIEKSRMFERRRKGMVAQVDYDEQELKKEKKISFNAGEKRSVAEKEVAKMAVDFRRMNVMIREVQNLYDDFREEYDEKQMRKAKNMLSRINTERKTQQELRKYLVSKGIDDRVAWRVAPDKKKKGILSIFKRKEK